MSKANREQNRRERAAAIQRASARAERNRRMAVVGGVVVVLALIVAGGFWYSSGGGKSATPTENVPAQIVDLAAAPAKEVVKNVGETPKDEDGSSAKVPTLVIGKKSAKVKVVVYEDFLCPYCREFEMASRDFLHADAAKGQVLVDYRPFHLLQPQYSTDALNAFAAVLKSSSPQVALKFHDILYKNQPNEASSSFPGADELADWAKEAGADADTVKKAVEAADPAYEQAVNKLAQESGLRGTPTIYVNGEQLGGRSVTEMASNLETMINDAYAKNDKGSKKK